VKATDPSKEVPGADPLPDALKNREFVVVPPPPPPPPPEPVLTVIGNVLPSPLVNVIVFNETEAVINALEVLDAVSALIDQLEVPNKDPLNTPKKDPVNDPVPDCATLAVTA
jgi:hypothetical protein